MPATVSRIQLADGLARRSISWPNRLRTMTRCWLMIPRPFQEAPDDSHNMAKVVPVRFTKSSACPRSSRAPTPMRVNLSGLSRANWSRPGASRRQVGQWGAQNHSTMGRSDGAKLARLTVAPVATFTISTEGRSESGSGVGSGVGAGVDSGVDWGVEAGVDSGVDCGVEAGVDSGVDCGVEPGVDSGVDCGVEAGVDSGVDCGVEPGVDSGVDWGVEPGVDSGVDWGVEAGVDADWVGALVASVSVGAAVESDWVGVLSGAEVSDPPQAAANRVNPRTKAAAATILGRRRMRCARMLTP